MSPTCHPAARRSIFGEDGLESTSETVPAERARVEDTADDDIVQCQPGDVPEYYTVGLTPGQASWQLPHLLLSTQ